MERGYTEDVAFGEGVVSCSHINRENDNTVEKMYMCRRVYEVVVLFNDTW